MSEGTHSDANMHAATLTCFLFPFLKPAMAKQMWDHCYLWYKSFNIEKMGRLLNDWNLMFEIFNQDSVKIVLKACHGWVGEPGSLFTTMTKEEKEGKFSPIPKKSRMIDTTLMFVDLVCHPTATYTKRQVKKWKPPEVVTLAERIERNDVTTTHSAVDSGGHTYYMTHVARWGNMYGPTNTENKPPLTLESLMAADKKQSGPRDANFRQPAEDLSGEAHEKVIYTTNPDTIPKPNTSLAGGRRGRVLGRG